MYWWNAAKLAEDFREGRVGEKERLKYFLATSILWALGSQPFFYYDRTFKIMDLISAAIFVAITIVGTLLCYRANRSGDNSDFIGRMICLSWPIGIKLAVLFATIGLVVFLFAGTLLVSALRGEFTAKTGDVLVEIFCYFIGICYYRLIYKYISLVAHAKASAAPPIGGAF